MCSRKYLNEMINSQNMFDLNDVDLSSIQKLYTSAQGKLVNHPKVKIIKATCFDKFWIKLRIKKSFIVAIDENILSAIDLKVAEKNFMSTMEVTYKKGNYFELKKDLSLKQYRNVEMTSENYKSLSEKKKLIFYFGHLGIDVYAGGREFDRINVFTDERIEQRYSLKYSINELAECINDYIIYANTPGVRESFFIDKTQLPLISDRNGRENILRHKPEDQLRNNLFEYLMKNTQHSWWKEDQLNSKKRLDLRTEAKGNSVFIEVKWIGRAVHENGVKLTKGYSHRSLREGVIQSLSYIKELNEQMAIKAPINYLCAFDAREKDKRTAIRWNEFEFIPKDLEHYHTYNFEILPLIEINRL